jgi:arsenate reductase-like glutaredoxin family protein
MILQANTIKELETQIKETNPRFIQLVNSQGTTFTVWNRSAQDRDEKAKEIIKILQSNNTPEDVYFIDARMTRQILRLR